MQKIGASTSSANALGEFTEGNPGAGVAATSLKAAWLNAVQRELVHLVEGAGLTLDAADDSQILKAIQALQVNASTWLKLSDKPTTIAGFGITDAYAKGETYTRLEINALTDQATESHPGTSRVATQEQMLVDTFDTLIVTPKKLRWGFSINLAANGYICLPSWLGGMILQWGRVTAPISNANATSTGISFPMAFPRSCYLVQAAPQGSGNTANGGIPSLGFSGAPSKNGTTVNLDMLNFTTINQPIPVAWWALGA